MKAVRILVLLSLVLTGLGFTATNAMAGAFASYTSSIQIQNLDSTDGSISLIFYKSDGSVETTVGDTILANDQKKYFPLPAGVGAGFNGAVVVTSTTNVASISNIVGTTGAVTAMGSYVADNSGSTTVTLPVLMKGNGSAADPFNTWFNVQNAGAAAATVTVNYTDGTSASFPNLAMGAAHTFDQATEAHTPKVFAGTVTSTQPVVVTVVIENKSILYASNGFKSGSQNPVMPLINVQPALGIQTGVNLANAGSAETTVTVTYTPGAAGTACTETQTIPAGSFKTFALAAFANGAVTGGTTTCAAHSRFVGSAKVTTNSGSQPLAINVTQLINSASLGNQGSAYNAFDATTATGKFVVPLAMSHNGNANQFYTTINLMNVSSTPTTVTCTFTNSSITQTTGTLNEGQGEVLFQDSGIPTTYVGGATCTASAAGAKIIAVVNEAAKINPGLTDLLLTYEAINIP
jgi:hypothetical protein